jgi:hypothetical protein
MQTFKELMVTVGLALAILSGVGLIIIVAYRAYLLTGRMTWKQRGALLLFVLAMIGTGLAIDAMRPARAEVVPTEPAPFELNSVIGFTEPTLGCPNVDDAVAAYKQQPNGWRREAAKTLTLT